MSTSAITVYGTGNFEVRDTSGNLYGTIGGDDGYFNLKAVSGRNMSIGASNATVFFANHVGTAISGGGLLGSSSAPWNTIYGGNLVSNNLYATGSASSIKYSGSKWNIASDTNVTGSIYASGAIECITARIKVGAYDFYPTTGAYNSSKYYLRT
jgi:hypothetical protein